MTELHDALEHCLEAMERGATLEHALRRFPQIAEELRPLLTASLMARSASRVHVPHEVRQRGRARLIRHAAGLTESHGSLRRGRMSFFPRFALTAFLVGVLALTSTGLVSASSAALPGQQLYPVKRTWESVRLLLVFNPGERDSLESDYEQERLDETYELLGRQIAAPISFSGLLTRRSDGTWLISGIPVNVSANTKLPKEPLVDGAPVTVLGTTRPDRAVEADEILALQPGSSLPPFEPSEREENEPEGQEGNPAGTIPLPSFLATPGAEPQHASYEFRGVVQSMRGTLWRINGQPVYVDAAQITGDIQVGSSVKFQGYYGADGKFIVTSIEARSRDSDGKGGGEGSDDSDGGGDSESESDH